MRDRREPAARAHIAQLTSRPAASHTQKRYSTLCSCFNLASRACLSRACLGKSSFLNQTKRKLTESSSDRALRFCCWLFLRTCSQISSHIRQRGGWTSALRSDIRPVKTGKPLRETRFEFSFHCVCPEPVLVNQSFTYGHWKEENRSGFVLHLKSIVAGPLPFARCDRPICEKKISPPLFRVFPVFVPSLSW